MFYFHILVLTSSSRNVSDVHDLNFVVLSVLFTISVSFLKNISHNADVILALAIVFQVQVYCSWSWLSFGLHQLFVGISDHFSRLSEVLLVLAT